MFTKLISLIQQSLSPDLLSSKYRSWQERHPLAGHCYVASESLWHLIGGKESGFTPHVVSFDNATHWWLENSECIRLDVTAEQFVSVPYEDGRGCGFLTKHPSKRAQIVIDRVLQLPHVPHIRLRIVS